MNHYFILEIKFPNKEWVFFECYHGEEAEFRANEVMRQLQEKHPKVDRRLTPIRTSRD